MFERLNASATVFTLRLGAALKMENAVLEMLGDLEQNSQRAHLKQHLRRHAEQTNEQIRNLEQAFAVLGEQPDEQPCPAIEAIQEQGRANLERAEDVVVDAVILAEAAEIERHEIAVYERLITEAEMIGDENLARLLRQNLEQEQRALEQVEHGRHQSAQGQPVRAG
jgi:ferritin-like metal-binding protein YciE